MEMTPLEQALRNYVQMLRNTAVHLESTREEGLGDYKDCAELVVMQLQRILDAEQKRLEPIASDPNRCAVCGWPLADSMDKGCVRGSCSMRPAPDHLYDAERYAAERSVR